MTNTLVALFNTQARAAQALQALVDAGIDQSQVAISPELSDAADTVRGDLPESPGRRDFFKSLFSDDDELSASYGKAVTDGKKVLTVDVGDEAQLRIAEEILVRFDPVDLDWQSTHRTHETALTGGDTTGQTTIPVIQEELRIGKRTVQHGGVRVIQRTITTPVQETVTLREEKIIVERLPVNREVSSSDMDVMSDRTVDVIGMTEEAVVTKDARVVEEIVIGTAVEHRTDVISDTVRSTAVDIERIETAGKQPPKQSR